jgi:hypothetical protein
MKVVFLMTTLLSLFCLTSLNAQWATDGFWLQAGNTMTAQQRDVRLFRFVAGAERGYHVFSGGASNPGTANLSLVDDDFNNRVELNANNRDLQLSTDNVSRIFIESSNGRVGVGNSSPDYRLDITGWLGIQTQNPQLVINRTSGSNSAIINFLNDGNTNASITVNSNGMSFKGGVVGPQIPSNTMQLAVSGSLTVPQSLNLNEGNPQDLAIRVRSDEALWYNDDYFSWGFDGSWNRFARPIKIGDATQPAPGIQLDVQGSVNITGELTTASDARLKENIAELSGSLDKLARLQPVSYTFKGDVFPDLHLPRGERIGLLAQQVEQHFPHLVTEGAMVEQDMEDDFAIKSVNYQELVPLLIDAVQELNGKVEVQAKMIQQQQMEINALKNARLKESDSRK